MNKNILIELLREWDKNFIPRDLHKRNFDYGMLDFKNKALVLMGLRRTGKSYLMFQIADYLFKNKNIPKTNLIYINFEDDRFLKPEISLLTDLLPVIKETVSIDDAYPIYLFLDEIQIIENWEKWTRRILDKEKNVRLIITGSSSKVAPSDIASAMRGRSIPIYVYPLSYNEFLEFKRESQKNGKPSGADSYGGYIVSDSTVKYSYQTSYSKDFLKKDSKMEYLSWGGMPEVALIDDERKKLIILQEYFDAIVSKEIKEIHEVNNQMALDLLLKLLIANFSSCTSISKLHNILKNMGVRLDENSQPMEKSIKVGKGTLLEYQIYIKESFFMDFIEIFSNNIKDKLQYPKKVYIADNGFIRALSHKTDLEPGRLLENLVFNELKRKGSRNIFYYRGKRECDFLTRNLIDIEQAIQVTWDLNSENYKREISGLLEAMEEFNLNEGILLFNTNVINSEKAIKEKIGSKNVQIKIIPVWGWME